MKKSRALVEHMGRSGAQSVYLGHHRVLARVLGEHMMLLDGDDLSVTPHLALNGYWESWVTAWLLKQDLEGQKVINIGAHCGYYTMILASAVGPTGRVVAMEPQLKLARLCADSAKLNGLQDRVEVVGVAAGAIAEDARFLHIPPGDTASASLTRDPEASSGGALVPVRRADAVAAGSTFAFIDAEGFEPEVWAGMSGMSELSTMVLEWTPSRYMDPGAFWASLQERFQSFAFIDDDGEERPVGDWEPSDPETAWCMLVLRRELPVD